MGTQSLMKKIGIFLGKFFIISISLTFILLFLGFTAAALVGVGICLTIALKATILSVSLATILGWPMFGVALSITGIAFLAALGTFVMGRFLFRRLGNARVKGVGPREESKDERAQKKNADSSTNRKKVEYSGQQTYGSSIGSGFVDVNVENFEEVGENFDALVEKQRLQEESGQQKLGTSGDERRSDQPSDESNGEEDEINMDYF